MMAVSSKTLTDIDIPVIDFEAGCVDVHLDLTEARGVVSTSDFQPDQRLRAAIDVLKSQGDWMDFERARLLERRMDEDAMVAQSGAVIDALNVVLLFVLLVGGFWLGDMMGWL